MENLIASLSLSPILVCAFMTCASLVIVLAVTVWKCFVRPLCACVHKARVMRPAVRPREISWAEYRRMNHPRHLL